MLGLFKESCTITKVLGWLLMSTLLLMPHGRNMLIQFLLILISQTLYSLGSSPALQSDLYTFDFVSLELFLQACRHETDRLKSLLQTKYCCRKCKDYTGEECSEFLNVIRELCSQDIFHLYIFLGFFKNVVLFCLISF